MHTFGKVYVLVLDSEWGQCVHLWEKWCACFWGGRWTHQWLL